MEQIKEAVETFVKAGDNNDTSLLEEILHPNYQNIQDGYFAEKGIYVFSKPEYIELVGSKKFGGNPRTIKYVSIEQLGNLAIVKVELERQDLKFISTIVCACSNDQWQVITNLPKIVTR